MTFYITLFQLQFHNNSIEQQQSSPNAENASVNSNIQHTLIPNREVNIVSAQISSLCLDVQPDPSDFVSENVTNQNQEIDFDTVNDDNIAETAALLAEDGIADETNAAFNPTDNTVTRGNSYEGNTEAVLQNQRIDFNTVNNGEIDSNIESEAGKETNGESNATMNPIVQDSHLYEGNKEPDEGFLDCIKVPDQISYKEEDKLSLKINFSLRVSFLLLFEICVN